MFCRPFGAYYCSATLSRGFFASLRRRRSHPRLWAFAPSALILRTAIIEYISWLITPCLCLYRPLGSCSVVAQLPGAITPVCALSFFRDFRQASTNWYSSEIPMEMSIVSHSTLHRLTLHGASAHAPRCIGSHSTLHRPTLHVASAHAPRSIGRCPKRHV